MGLGLPQSSSGGDRTAIVKYDARAGRLFRIDRSNASGEWTTNPVEVTNSFQAIMDLANIETGWLSFPKGAAPDIRTVKIGNPLPERPSDQHKVGFRVLMKLGKSLGGDLREMAANAGVSIKGMDALYDAYLKDAGANPGKLPVVALETTVAVTSGGKEQSSTNYQPVWKIVGWADRPPELGGEGAPTAASPPPPPAAPSPAATRELASVGAEF